MQRFIGIGNITRNLELKYTTTNKAIIETNIAIKRGFTDETDFINIQVWGKQAENLAKYCGKGSKIAIDGELRIDSFDGRDGKKVYKTYILVGSVEFLDTKKKENKVEEKQKAVDNTDIFQEFANEVEIEESMLPF